MQLLVSFPYRNCCYLESRAWCRCLKKVLSSLLFGACFLHGQFLFESRSKDFLKAKSHQMRSAILKHPNTSYIICLHLSLYIWNCHLSLSLSLSSIDPPIMIRMKSITIQVRNVWLVVLWERIKCSIKFKYMPISHLIGKCTLDGTSSIWQRNISKESLS